MNEELKFIVGTVAGLLTGGLIQAWFNRRKTNSDAYSTLLDALQKSGQTIDDLFGMLAEVPRLRQELSQVKADWKMDNLGAWANHDALLANHLPAPYRPKKKYQDTGPLAAAGTGQT